RPPRVGSPGRLRSAGVGPAAGGAGGHADAAPRRLLTGRVDFPWDRWAEVDLGAVRHNVRYLLDRLPPGTRLLAVVKANGYGHGAEPVARAVLQAGAWGLAVATPTEAEPLLSLLDDPARLLVMGGLTPDAARRAARLGCAIGVFSLETAAAL